MILKLPDNTDSANKIELFKQDKNYLIDFDFIDPHQGVIIKVTHSGKNSKDIIIEGRVKGGFILEPKGSVGFDSEVSSVFNKHFPLFKLIINNSFLKYITFLLGFSCILVSIFLKESSFALRIVIGVFGGIYSLFGISWISEKPLPKDISKKFNAD